MSDSDTEIDTFTTAYVSDEPETEPETETKKRGRRRIYHSVESLKESRRQYQRKYRYNKKYKGKKIIIDKIKEKDKKQVILKFVGYDNSIPNEIIIDIRDLTDTKSYIYNLENDIIPPKLEIIIT